MFRRKWYYEEKCDQFIIVSNSFDPASLWRIGQHLNFGEN